MRVQRPDIIEYLRNLKNNKQTDPAPAMSDEKFTPFTDEKITNELDAIFSDVIKKRKK